MNQCQQYCTLKNPLTLGVFGLNAFRHPWTYQVSYVFPPPGLVLLVLSIFLAEHVTGQFRFLNVVAPCWNEAHHLPTILHMLEDIPHWCPVIRYLVRNVSVGSALRNVCCHRQGFSSSAYQAMMEMTWAFMVQVYQQCQME